mgnify:CR=1 FL=1
MKRFTLAIIIIPLLFIFTYSCSDDESEPVRVYGEDTFVYDVEYSENTKIFADEIKESLIKVDTTTYTEYDPSTETDINVHHYTFTFDDLSVLDSLGEGSILVIYGDYMTKVKSVVQQGNDVIVVTEPATLKEVIKNGTIEWDMTPGIELVQKIQMGDDEVKGNGILNDEFEYKFEWLDRKYTIWMNPHGVSPNGLPQLQVNFTCQKTDKDNGRVTATLGAKGTTTFPRQHTKMEFSDNEMTTLQTNNNNLRSELTLEYVAEMSFGGTQVITLPKVALKIPVQSLTSIPIPVPMYITVGVAFQSTINMPVVSSFAHAKVKLILDSDTGFDYVGPTIEASAKVNDYDLGEAAWAIGATQLAPTPLEVRYDVSCPRIGIEIAGSELAWLSGVFSSRAKLIVPSLCKAALYQVRIDGGYSLKVMGYSIADKSGNITEVSRTEKSPECP